MQEKYGVGTPNEKKQALFYINSNILGWLF